MCSWKLPESIPAKFRQKALSPMWSARRQQTEIVEKSRETWSG
jgi:hypothetical protein